MPKVQFLVRGRDLYLLHSVQISSKAQATYYPMGTVCFFHGVEVAEAGN
jgi:hypothetical protein